MRASVGASCVLAAAALSVGVPSARGDEDRPRDAGTFLVVAKSENRNEVHYGMHVDSSCAPAGDQPAFAYWRMLERGPAVTEPLLNRELRAYGIAEQRVLSRDARGGAVHVRLFATRARPMVVESRVSEGGCALTAVTTVAGVTASLTGVFVQLRWPFGVDSLILTGRALDDGRAVRERLRP